MACCVATKCVMQRPVYGIQKCKDLAGIEPKTRFALVGAHQSGLRNRYTKPSFIIESRYTQCGSGMHSVIALLAS